MTCANNKNRNHPKVAQPMINDTALLAINLIKVGYPSLFRNDGHESELEKVWQSAAPIEFENLVADKKQPTLARFLASLVLLKRDMTFYSRTNLGVAFLPNIIKMPPTSPISSFPSEKPQSVICPV